jgi:hypothetical protein
VACHPRSRDTSRLVTPMKQRTFFLAPQSAGSRCRTESSLQPITLPARTADGQGELSPTLFHNFT